MNSEMGDLRVLAPLRLNQRVAPADRDDDRRQVRAATCIT